LINSISIKEENKMLLGKPYNFLSEAATMDLMDPTTAPEVRETIEELEDELANNVEEVKPDEMVTNGGVPVTTAESAILIESNGCYYVAMEAVLAIAEDVATDEANGEEPTADEVAGEVPGIIDHIAKINGVDVEDIKVVISAEESAYICECAINESKASKGKKKGGKSAKKAKILAKAAKALEGKIKIFKKKK
jgi:hypothetical protein